jgi:hypothetical protein
MARCLLFPVVDDKSKISPKLVVGVLIYAKGWAVVGEWGCTAS